MIENNIHVESGTLIVGDEEYEIEGFDVSVDESKVKVRDVFAAVRECDGCGETAHVSELVFRGGTGECGAFHRRCLTTGSEALDE